MKFEIDRNTGTFVPKKDDNIYFGGSQGGGLIVDDRKNGVKYIVERDGGITWLFSRRRDTNLYDMRDARVISDRVLRKFGSGHRCSDYRYFLKGAKPVSEGMIPTFGEFVGEGYLTKITKEYFGDGEERLEEKIAMDGVELVDFTDNNGKFHRKGYRVTNGDNGVLKRLIQELVCRKGFDCDLNCIDVSNVSDMSYMFYDSSFCGDVSGWDVSNVWNMEQMFRRTEFNGDISKWDVSNVTDMSWMFTDNIDFKGDISKWNVSKVEFMDGMFASSMFNGDISEWDVSGTVYMGMMFFESNFNGDISKWDVSNVKNMDRMFSKSAFSGDISEWKVSSETYMVGMFKNSPLEYNPPKWYREKKGKIV